MKLFHRFYLDEAVPLDAANYIRARALNKQKTGLEIQITTTHVDIEIPQFDTCSFQLRRPKADTNSPSLPIRQCIWIDNALPDNLRIGDQVEIITDTSGTNIGGTTMGLLTEPVVILSVTICEPVLFAVDKYQVELGTYRITRKNNVLKFTLKDTLLVYRHNMWPSLANTEHARYEGVVRATIVSYERKLSHRS